VTVATLSARSAPTAWQVWGALWTVYLVWGSTYLAIRVMVETMPPLLGSAARFVLAGAILLGFLAARRGVQAVTPSRVQIGSALAVGGLLVGANAIVGVAEQDVPSGLAALLVASVPLWLLLMRRASGERMGARRIAAVGLGFAGVALLLAPGEQPEGAPVLGLLAVVGASAMWASGSFAAPRVSLPADPLTSTGWQMLLGGLVCASVGLGVGEAGDVDVAAFSGDSLLAFAYLVVVGSLVAFTAYAWLLQNAPLGKVATYAYVNPVVAILLGWLILDETVTAITLVGAAIIVASVALVVRMESAARR
jgi:drug/metabolite transporter (DMT)-like permease